MYLCTIRTALPCLCLLICLAQFSQAHGQVPQVTLRPVADSPNTVCPVLPGSTVPDVTLRAADGSAVALLPAVKQKPTILIVYRGGW